ncbi:hypothetical protein SKDZ_11G1640 [Saccharomyces kudriavzevii ZP591]|uniref:Phd1p n=1 Tax=Saccharomyces cerevisiae x Saccharomyces kudriavzevii (strain VIN7) TaxID=1095631 RepID=H0GXJ2_SACCK|nr:Phd1p [Saccharomyces cerevisiae x Saccharomyces kudriavzevii VIN7]CAI4044879.1 hypothetical protein SKDZ_11G1640 [Saccharomyces kudriavzevii ZP591]
MYHVPEMRLHYPLVNTQSNAAITPTRNYDNTLPSFNELSHQNTINLPFIQRKTPNAYANVAQLATSPTPAKSGYYCRYYAVPFPSYPQQPPSPYQQAMLPYATIPGNNFQPSPFPMMAVMSPEVQFDGSYLNSLHAHTELPPIMQGSNDVHNTRQNALTPMAKATATAMTKMPGFSSTSVLKPRVITTMWEDESTICYQVEANGISVVRRADNNMINGTKLLNVTKMTRGRRDGILRSEKVREVVKIGSMHLKGVWIPFERAYILAQREQILDHMYPLFVKDIESMVDASKATDKILTPESNPCSIKQELSEGKDEFATEIKLKGSEDLLNGVSNHIGSELTQLKINDFDTEAQTSRAKNELS